MQPKSTRCIQYNTPILATEFIFAGFPIKYLCHIFDKILNKRIEFENNKVKTEAPLPKSLLDLMKDDDPEPFYQAAKSYLEQRSLKQQLQGLFFLFKNYEQKKVFLFQLDKVIAVGTLSFTYYDVVISNSFRQDYVVEGSTSQFYSDFFNSENTLFAQVEITGNNNDGSLEKAKRKVLEALDYFNSTLQKNAIINLNQFILKDRNDNFRRVNSPQVVHTDDVEKLIENNLYGALSSSRSRLAKRMLDIEKIFFAAKSSPFKEVRLVNYWRYLECFFDANDFDAANIEETISQILSINFLFDYAWTHFYLAEAIFSAAYFNFRSRQHYEYFGISEKEYELLTTPPSANEIDFDRIVEVINHPYVTTKLREYITTTPEVLSENMRMYYQKLLLETYEQRNLIEHAGTFQEKAVEKVLIRLSFIVSYIRNLITQCVLTNKFVSFKDILLFLKNNDFYALNSEESPIL